MAETDRKDRGGGLFGRLPGRSHGTRPRSDGRYELQVDGRRYWIGFKDEGQLVGETDRGSLSGEWHSDPRGHVVMDLRTSSGGLGTGTATTRSDGAEITLHFDGERLPFSGEWDFVPD